MKRSYLYQILKANKMALFQKIKWGLLGLLVLVTGVLVNEWHQTHINYNFKTITKGKFYKSGVIPPNRLPAYIAQYHIKTIIDLRQPGTKDTIHNPEERAEVLAEQKAIAALKNVNYVNIPSDQIPTDDNLTAFWKVLDVPENYPVLIHCYHGYGRAVLYSALYRIEYENMSNEKAWSKTRFFTGWSPFAPNAPKGRYLLGYQSRRAIKNQEHKLTKL